MTAPSNNRATGKATLLATYECDEGTRQLVAQRVNGEVALSDIPTGDAGKVYLVERHISRMDELGGIVADYCELAEQLGRVPMQCDWIFEN